MVELVDEIVLDLAPSVVSVDLLVLPLLPLPVCEEDLVTFAPDFGCFPLLFDSFFSC